jgi:small subunit ribosomal protein S2
MQTITLQKLIKARIHLRYPIQYWSRTIKKYRYTTLHGYDLIDIVKTHKKIDHASKFITIVTSEGNNVLFVSTRNYISRIIRLVADRSMSFFVRGRWLGGTLTNKKISRQSLLKMHLLVRQEKKGLFIHNTNERTISWHKRIKRLKKYFRGRRGIHSLPSVTIVFHRKIDKTAIEECHKLSIPVICRLDVRYHPNFVTIGVPINTESIFRIHLFIETILESLHEGRRWWVSRKVKKQKRLATHILMGKKRYRKVLKVNYTACD